MEKIYIVTSLSARDFGDWVKDSEVTEKVFKSKQKAIDWVMVNSDQKAVDFLDLMPESETFERNEVLVLDVDKSEHYKPFDIKYRFYCIEEFELED